MTFLQKSREKNATSCQIGISGLKWDMVEPSFKEYVLDQLAALPEVRAKAMFGAYGLYSGDHFFGIVDEGRLFFKTDPQSQAEYIERGMEPFRYESQGQMRTMAYHEVPPDVLEQPQELTAWARRAIAVAAAAQRRKPKARPSA